MPLKPQEMRNALYQGRAKEFVNTLAENILANYYFINKERMLDKELVTRFLAFYINGYEKYSPDLNTFLNYTMEELQNMS